VAQAQGVERQMRYAKVVVNTRVQPQRITRVEPRGDATNEGPSGQTFHYSVPPDLRDQVSLGQLVVVPFGRRRLQGVIFGFDDSSPVVETKDLYEIADLTPVLSPDQMELASWISEYYLAPLIDAVLLMLPPGVTRKTRTMVGLNPDVAVPPDLDAEQQAMVALLQREGEVPLSGLGRRPGLKNYRRLVEGLARRGVIQTRSLLAEARARPKTEQVARLKVDLTAEVEEKLQNAPVQRAIVEYLDKEGPTAASDIYARVGGSTTTLRALVEKGLVEVEEQEVWRDPLQGRTFVLRSPPRLTEAQDAAWREIEASLSRDGSEVFLLHGVTGSGKTEIYLRALDEVLARGQQAIVLVPEIALTPQTIRRFAARFPGRIAVLHSGLSMGERYDGWRRVRDGLVDIVIGSRSAVFAPVPSLGIIVIDEEHEWSYKQDRTPRYHARDVAVKRAEIVGCKVILGTATPDLVSYYRAEQGRYRLLHLPKRIMGHRRRIEEQRVQHGLDERRMGMVREVAEGYDEAMYMELPPVQVVDLRQELKAGNRSIFSRALQEAMAEVLAAHEQVILFLNRRGATTFVICRDCGYVLKCKRCDVPLTYHSADGGLVCHHCNWRTFLPDSCPSCRSDRIKQFGLGTQRVEAVTRQLFPEATIVRWDRDTTGGKMSHEKILQKFINHEADVMIGTQMIAKGLDLPLVTLVGVMSADTALRLPDFRAGERTFQLLTQVAGRAGRSPLGGKVILQTYAPDHYCITAASQHDYEGFYRQEMEFRREQRYPPFSRLVRLVYVHRDAERCEQGANKMRDVLENRIARLGLPEIDVIGPAPAFLSRIRGQYRWHLVVRGRDPHALLEGVDFGRGWRVDVDPVSLL
jgi:primosomal protein N' (replication factor Y)